MAANQAEPETEKTAVIEPTEGPTVHVTDIVDTRYGPKALLGGDTYDAKESIKDLPWEEAHPSWDGERHEAWTIDAGAVDLARDELDAMAGSVAERTMDAVEDAKPEDSGYTYWEDSGVRLLVAYESKQSGDVKTKEGAVHGVNRQTGSVTLKRDDDTINRLNGDELYSTYSKYPYMGDVVFVEVHAPAVGDDPEPEPDEALGALEEVETKVGAAADLALSDAVSAGFDECLRIAALKPDKVREGLESGRIEADEQVRRAVEEGAVDVELP